MQYLAFNIHLPAFILIFALPLSVSIAYVEQFTMSNPQRSEQSSAQVLETLDASSLPRMLSIRCANCACHNGYFNISISSVVLFKWQVSCQTVSARLEPTASDCLAANLLATLARSGSAKSVVLPTLLPQVPTAHAIHIWILNGNMAYSSTAQRGGARPALKLLYRYIAQDKAEEMLESFSTDIQEVNLPADAIEAVVASLETSTLYLPPAERVFKDFQVGLLSKWTG